MHLFFHPKCTNLKMNRQSEFHLQSFFTQVFYSNGISFKLYVQIHSYPALET